jgi:hypothetical protein
MRLRRQRDAEACTAQDRLRGEWGAVKAETRAAKEELQAVKVELQAYTL